MSNLIADMAKIMSDGIERAAVSRASDWALKYRVMGPPFSGPWTFDHHPWSKDIHDCPNEHIVGQKAAQMGYTEAAINRAFKVIDIDRESVLYVLPTQIPDAVDFSSARFDPALEASEHLQNLFSDTKNLGLKRAGTACLYVRSARSRSQLKSIPAGHIMFDEMDEMEEKSVILGRERSSGQLTKSEFDLSTPTIPRFGINAEFERSDQRHFVFKCPHCSRWTELDDFENCLVITAEQYHEESIRNSYYKCKECNHKLDHKTKSEWLSLESGAHWQQMYTGRHVAGFWINQMYSYVIEPYQFAISCLRRHRSVEDETEFYNSKLGLPHVIRGSKISDDDLELCKKNYTKQNTAGSNQYICMGVDVGNKIHVEITEYLENPKLIGTSADVNLITEARLVCELTVDEFEELDELMARYSVNYCVIDRQPEQRKAKEFTNRWRGIARTCVTTGDKMSGRSITLHDWEDEQSVSIDKVSWMDMALSRIKKHTMAIPVDTSLEYKEHLKEPVRVYLRDKEGRPRGRYVTSDADHFAMARTYCEVALRIGLGAGANEDIKDSD